MIEKQQFKNNTAGWQGVVVIGPKGDERGASVAPGATVWLSEAEQTLTANAPRKAEDNPFIEQTLIVVDRETGAQQEQKITPLTPVEADRWVPAQGRYVPGVGAEGARGVAQAQVAATGDEPVYATTLEMGALQREAEVREIGPDAQPHQQPAVPRAAAAAAAAASMAEEGLTSGTLTTPENAPEAPQTPPASTEPTPAPAAPEETAAEAPSIPDETGAAASPTGPAPEGEYTASEEVGTPVPTQPQPAPYTPPQE